MAILETTPWMIYNSVELYQYQWLKICRITLQNHFALPLKNRIKLIAHDSPGKDRVEVKKDEIDFHIIVEGVRRQLWTNIWQIAERLLKKHDAFYVECLTE